MVENRETIARDMAEKSGLDFDLMEDVLKNAYLHNADEDIKTRAEAPIIVNGVAVEYVCKVCQDTAYLGSKPCHECNPAGLPSGVVHPHTVKVQEVTEVLPSYDPYSENRLVVEDGKAEPSKTTTKATKPRRKRKKA